ncbi:aldehyde dehydrogenase family protein [Catenulispora rubra]|uniref:aldehyde dehydrogenase family protein n=1 Tax=Catenulispora rubra TaxID=280293 RepID=UPI0018926B2E|nr:aldehyde dehydrogenase family protein [Catenulispora rubra]
MAEYAKLYIGGSWVDPVGTERLDVIDSTTEDAFATIPAGAAADIDRAVAAAESAFGSWSAVAPADRAGHLRQVAARLKARREEIADIETREIGMPRPLSAAMQVEMGIRAFATAADVAETFPFEDRGDNWVLREPIGVVGAITPWNYPLNQIGAKVAYALAAGCTVVLKPSEVAPLSAFVLAEIIDECGFTAGAFNLVTGVGPVVGEALAAHPDVDMVSFTGSNGAGRRVAELAGPTVKRVALELGGKSPNVILDDADLPTAVAGGVASAFLNSGQTCSALTRMIVPRAHLAEVERLARSAAESFTVGDPFDARTRLGPLISAVQRDRVRGYIVRGLAEGARLITGGAEAPDGLDRGYFVRPTVFSDVTPDMTIAREEIFGPVLVIIAYDTEDEAVEIANDTVYGLAAGVSGSEQRAHRVARRIRAGQVRVNGERPSWDAPFGGYKQSGLGREHGRYGLEEFLEVKAVFAA